METVPEDRVTAAEFLDQAKLFLDDASGHELSAPSEAVLLQNAAISAYDAILQAAGLRVTAGDGAHVLRMREALAQLDQDTDDLYERLDATRERRHEASYAAMPVAAQSVSEAREAIIELIELSRAFIEG